MKNLPFFSFIIVVLFIASCKSSDDSVKLIPIKSGDKWGYIDASGNFVINSQFEDAYNFSDGLALVETSDKKWGYIGENGKYVINPIYKQADKFSEGLACVVMENSKPQYIDKTGKIMFTIDKADYCSGFSEGMAKVKINGKWGYIDNTGKVVVNPIYEDAKRFSNGLAAVAKVDDKTKEKRWGFIDKTGAMKITFQFASESDKLYCEPDCFKDGLAFVSSDGKKWGCINTDGKYQINPQFEGADFNPYGFKNDYSVIAQGESYGYIDEKGKYQINPQFKCAFAFSNNGLAAVQNSDKKWGFIDKQGRYIINPQFDGVMLGFVGDIAFVKSSDKYGIIDKKGQFKVNPQFDDVRLFDINMVYGVKSDYIDNDAIAGELFSNSGKEKFRGLTKKSTLGDIVNLYPGTKVDNLETYTLKIDSAGIDISNMINVNSIRFGFDDKTYTETPLYRTVSTYSWYTGSYYDRQVFDKFEKKINTTTNLTYTSVDLTLQTNSKEKGKPLAEAIKKNAIKVMNVSPVENPDIKNTDTSGIFILDNNDVLVVVKYFIAEDTQQPEIDLAVINNNFSESFDNLAKSLVSIFEKPNDE